MDFSQLPFEIQYEYLLRESLDDILNYCQTSRRAQQICDDPFFWNQKALLDYGIPLEYAPKAKTLAQRYADLWEEYINDPGVMLIKLIQGGLIPQALELEKHFIPDQYEENQQDVLERLLMVTVESGQKELLSKLIREIHPDDNLARAPFFQAIRMGRQDLAEIIGDYYNPEDDDNIYQEYYDAIHNHDERVLEYLTKALTIDPEHEFYIAFRDGDQQIIDYLLRRYPDLLQDRSSVDRIAENLIRANSTSGLERLHQLAGI